jgi:hypothetical protein
MRLILRQVNVVACCSERKQVNPRPDWFFGNQLV